LFGKRVQLAVLTFLALLLVCIAKLAHLQFRQYSKYLLAAQSSLTSEELVPAPRGQILDCTGKRVLAEDVPSFDISVVPAELRLQWLSISNLKEIRKILKEPAEGYEKVLLGSYADFAGPGYRPQFREEFEKLRGKIEPGERPAPELLRSVRYLRYRAERASAVDRLAARDTAVRELAACAGVSPRRLAEGLVAAMEHVARGYGGSPPPAVTGISREAWDRLRLRQHYPLISGRERFPGVVTSTGVRRHYPHGRTACHVLGYLTPMKESHYRALAVHQDGIMTPDPAGKASGGRGWRWFFRPNEGERYWLRPRGRLGRGKTLSDERVGAAGVEKLYNEHLRGKHAYHTWILTLEPGGFRGGVPERDFVHRVPPRRGGDLRLTIDLVVQKAAERALAEAKHKGAAVFLDPNDGAVIAMASYPAFDPAVFVGEDSDARVRLMHNPEHPLICRAHQGTYPPGSVFKTVVGTGALEVGAINPGTTFTCTHVLRVGRRYFECLGTHGNIDFSVGLYKSCNIYFYHTGMALERWSQRAGGPEEPRRLGGLGHWGRAFGVGRRTGLDLPGEARGLMPSREWKAKVYAGQRGMTAWTDGDSCNTAIGQGAVLVTPLQAALAMAAIANGGRVVRPHVVLEAGSGSPGGVAPGDGWTRWQLPLAERRKTLRKVREAMVEVVDAPWGTGRLAKMPNVVVAGKTGSAENPHGRTHAWFCGFAPADDPTIAFAVVLENAGHGGAEAAPVARKVLEVLFPHAETETEAEG
jgi:cell division protein FtsI/penicillin-binding protein 2